MAIINLRDYYPFYTSDCFMEVSEEVAEMFKEFDRKEAAYRLRTYRHKAYYSLDRDDGLEHEAVFVALSPHELYERKVTMQELHAAIASLPDKQAKRIYAHFILGMTKQDIARAEGVHEKVVRVAIERGLRRLEDLYILPDMQNMGYGTKLLLYAVGQCTDTPTLWILENNINAERLYRRIGFKETGRKNAIINKLDEIEFALT